IGHVLRPGPRGATPPSPARRAGRARLAPGIRPRPGAPVEGTPGITSPTRRPDDPEVLPQPAPARVGPRPLPGLPSGRLLAGRHPPAVRRATGRPGPAEAQAAGAPPATLTGPRSPWVDRVGARATP